MTRREIAYPEISNKSSGVCTFSSKSNPSIVSYSAAISACEQAGRADEALAVLDEMVGDERIKKLTPIPFNAALGSSPSVSTAREVRRRAHRPRRLGEAIGEVG